MTKTRKAIAAAVIAGTLSVGTAIGAGSATAKPVQPTPGGLSDRPCATSTAHVCNKPFKFIGGKGTLKSKWF